MQTIPIYIISLRRTPERRLQIQRQLDAFKLKYHWIEAVDAYDLGEYESQIVNLENLSINRLGALGCLLSHIKFYDQVIKNNHEIACVLEDDAQLLPSFPNVLKSEKLQNSKWEILLLGHQSEGTGELLKQYYTYAGIRYQRVQMYDRYTLGALPGNFSKKICAGHYITKTKEHTRSTIGYLVRLSTAQKLKETTLAYKDYLYIDEITGNEYLSKITTKLITPPCIKGNISYFRYSLLCKIRHTDKSTKKLPDEEFLHCLMRNKWTTIIMQLVMCKRPRLMVRFSIALAISEWEKMKKFLIPNERYGKRVLLAKKYRIAK